MQTRPMTSGSGERRQSITEARVRAMLATSAHFADLRESSRETLAQLAQPVRFRDTQLVQGAHPPSARLWLIVSGALRLSLPSPDRPAVTIAVIGPGSYYSVGALVGSRESITDSHAIGETELAMIESEALLEAVKRDAVLGPYLATLVVRRINALVLLIADVRNASLETRLARRMLSQALAQGERRAAELEVRLSQTMLAEMLGTSRSQVNAQLRSFETRRIVRIAYRRVYIIDVGRLSSLAGPDVQPI